MTSQECSCQRQKKSYLQWEFTQLRFQGYEADDILATLATQAREAKIETIVITGDRDSYQLVEDPYIKGFSTIEKGVSDYILFDEEGIRERTGVAPTDYVKYACSPRWTNQIISLVFLVWGRKNCCKISK